MDIDDYKTYISAETMMGPNSVRILAELFNKFPLQPDSEDVILDLGCGTGMTSFIIAKETGARVFANDLWVSAEENGKRFFKWGVGERITPVCEDANNLSFEKKQFRALVSIDSYHYFGGGRGFFQEKILPFMKDNGEILIGIPGLKNEYTDRAEELLSDWLGEDAYMFKSPKHWKELIGGSDRIETVKTWEMDCFSEAWDDWLATNKKFALSDKRHFETIIKPYTCFVGIYIRLKEALEQV
ncbi:MAG: methyltransferase domain-containing protein [Alistipes sp.]|nr:methyltransferase domain-containing protein [Alistipes sp.]